MRYNLTRPSLSPVNAKAQEIKDSLRPTNWKQLQSFLRVVDQINKFNPKLAAISYPFRKVGGEDADWKWNSEVGKVFSKINEVILESSWFKRSQEIILTCDASTQA